MSYKKSIFDTTRATLERRRPEYSDIWLSEKYLAEIGEGID